MPRIPDRWTACASALVLAALFVVSWTAQAGAATTASFAAGTLTITGDAGANIVWLSHDGSAIHVYESGLEAAVSGGPATLTNTDSISIDLGDGDDRLTIDERNGLFAPGATPEVTGASEIEFYGSMGDDAGDLIVVKGQDSVGDSILLFNLNGDDDFDVSIYPDLIRVEGGGGADSIVMSFDSGGPGDEICVTMGSVTIVGGPGDDTLVGGVEADALIGGDGADVIDGHSRDPQCAMVADGGDTVRGGPGADTIRGAAGDNTIFGGTGPDVVTGGVDIDTIFGGAGDDVLTSGPYADKVWAPEAIRGRGGDDTIDVVDGSPGDLADGDAGSDVCTGDAGDILKQC